MLESIFIKLGFAALLGFLLGIEREIKRKPLGLKTCLVISLTSCLITIVGVESAEYARTILHNPSADPMRLAAGVVQGVGFLGAGVIMKRTNDTISGLTTAAVVWGASGLGLAAGAGYYYEALICVIFMFVSVEIIPYLMKRIGPKTLREKEVSVSCTVSKSTDVESLIRKIESNSVKVENIAIKGIEIGQIQITMTCAVDARRKVQEIYDKLKTIDDVYSMDIEGL